MSRQPKEKWCPYCQHEIDQWVSKRKVDRRHNSSMKKQKMGSNVKYWFLCPHCDQKHPWYQFEWLQFVFVALGIGSVIAVRCYQQKEWISTGIMGVAIGIALTFLFRIAYTRYMYRKQPVTNEES